MLTGPIAVRTAGLDDVAGIHAVHKSDVLAWRRLTGVDGEYDELTILERYLNGGPWMSPETCAVYVNDLILASTPPIIALADGRIVGEMELLYGDDLNELGKSVCLSILYTERSVRGQGVGRALMDEAIRRGRALGCQTIENSDPEVDALPFYERQGFRLLIELVALTVPAVAGDGSRPAVALSAEEIRPLDALAALGESDRLVIGRHRHPALVKQVLRQGAGRGLLAVPGVGDQVRAFHLSAAGQVASVFFRTAPLRKGAARAYVFAEEFSSELANAVVALAARAGQAAVVLTVRAGAEEQSIGGATDRRSHQIYALEL